MSDAIVLKIDSRDILGKQVKRLRQQGLVPAVIHDGSNPVKHISVPFLEMTRIWQRAGKHHTIELEGKNNKQLAIIKDVDIEPKKYQIRHVVFNTVSQDKEIEAEIPISLVGDVPAEKTGLIVLHQLTEIGIKSLPKDLPDKFEIDASNLIEVGDKLMVSDIKLPQGVKFREDILNHPIATVAEPRAHVADELEQEEEVTPEEGEETESEIQEDSKESEPETS